MTQSRSLADRLADRAKRLLPPDLAYAVLVATIALPIVLWVLLVGMRAERDAHATRAAAWDAAMAQADSLEGKRILAFARSSAEGRDCRPFSHQSGPGFDLGYQAHYRANLDSLIQGEQACLEQLKGQVLAGQAEGQAAPLDLALPR